MVARVSFYVLVTFSLTLPCALSLYQLYAPLLGDGLAKQLEKGYIPEVCYDHLGCFNTTPPFDNAQGYLPSLPGTVAVEFRLYLSGSKDPIHLDYFQPMAANVTEFNSSLPTKFIIHGFGNNLDKDDWIGEMRDAILDLGDTNVIEVGWNTQFPNYFQAVANTRLVAKAVVLVIKALQKNGLDLSNVHLIGHSLGSHVAGYAGSELGSSLARITGLDPAGPCFTKSPPEVRLDPSDAHFVDVIHSNGHALSLMTGGFGMLMPSGDVDFFPNGGSEQHGCADGMKGAAMEILADLNRLDFSHLHQSAAEGIGCSHGRSSQIFIESIRTSSCKFHAIPCNSYEDFLAGKCKGCGPKGCNYAGLYADVNKEGGRQFFKTNSGTPLCGYPYLLTIVPSGFTNNLHGELNIKVTGSNAVVDTIVVNGPIAMSSTAPFKTVVTFHTDLGSISKVVIRYERANFFKRRQVMLEKVEIEKIWGEKRFVASSSQASSRLWTHTDLDIDMVSSETDTHEQS